MEKIIVYIAFSGILFCQEFNYKIYSLFNIPVADVKMSIKDTTIENQYSKVIDMHCKTVYIADYLYSVNNRYKVAVDSNFNILYFRKHINQPNIQSFIYTTNNDSKIVYNQTDIEIPKDTFNIFSLMYYLSVSDYESIQTHLINNQIEKDGAIYSFSLKSKQKEDWYIYDIIINEQKQGKHLIQYTDILNWGLFKKNALRRMWINYKDQKINRCYFEYGFAYFTAYLE